MAASSMTLARPDLSTRVALSKSALVGFDLCSTKAGFELTQRLPMLPSEKVSFGSALDGAIEHVIVGARDGTPALDTMTRVAEAIEAVEVKDGMDLPTDELMRAVNGFRAEVLPNHDWSGVATQPDLWAEIPGLGQVNGHPDVVMADNRIWDVKSSSREKPMPSLELGLYAVLLERAHEVIVPEVGYLTWVRSGRGRWVTQRMTVDAELRRWVWENARRYAMAREKDAFYGGPKFPGLCTDCQYNPANGGPCAIAFRGGPEE